MGIGDVSDFQVAGKTLYSLGLVKGSEGNLSTFDGRRLLITRTGVRLAELTEDDVLEGTLDDPPDGASSDLERHVSIYRSSDSGAVVHAHPKGTVPDGWVEGEPHGVYTYGATLEQAAAAAIGSARHLMVRPVELRDGRVEILDQTRLPADEIYLQCRSAEEVADAIRRMAVRGAPILGIAAAYGLVLAAGASAAGDHAGAMETLEHAGRMLIETRPTAVNIRWAVERVLGRIRAEAADADIGRLRRLVLEEARAIEREDAEACSAIGRFGRDLVPEGANVLTHCNTGMLCTAGIGTALGVIYSAHLEGKAVHAWVDETRPLLQGARLTAWELERLGIPMTLVADSAAGSLMAAERVDLVIVGADRIAANGDVANKIGTYPLAVLADHHEIPFYVAAPTSTIDLGTASGSDIEIEERDPVEVTAPLGLVIAPKGTRAANPAFDVTPESLVTAIVTELGVLRPPFTSALRTAVDGAAGL
ncbi:MAG: S-methyl-5-thioribose-1-phosphate isomerase [Actinomycetota bacterium]